MQIQDIEITKEQLNILNDRGEIFLNDENISITADIVQSNPRIDYINGHFEIDGIEINEDIFQEEKYDYYIVDRDDEIDNLFMWINEAEDKNNKESMKADLIELLNMKEDYIFSSNESNEYLDSTYGNHYNSHCDAILKLNKK